MRRTMIKICGLTRPDDVRAAVGAGADACGFVFAPSPRQVTVEQASELAKLVPPTVERVGVFVDASAEDIEAAVKACGLGLVQLCGTESPELIDELSVPAIKVVHVSGAFDWAEAEPYLGHVAGLLLDTQVAGKAGGTSQCFAWEAAGAAPSKAPVFVAGGLDAENVGDAIATLRPYGVDVSSGVESAPGLKDPLKIESFVAAVRAADQEVCPR